MKLLKTRVIHSNFMFDLRDYQIEAVKAVREDLAAHKKALLCLATGLGKTLVSFEVMKTFNSALFVTNKIDLAEQSMERWIQYYSNASNIGLCVASRGRFDLKDYTFSTVQTSSRLDLSKFELVVIDETHVDMNNGYYDRLIKSAPQASVLGLTATPFRTSSGYIFGEKSFYPKVTFERDIKWGVEHAFLVEPRLKAGGDDEFDTTRTSIKMGDFDLSELGEMARNKDKVRSQVIDALGRLKDRKCVVWSCVNIEHSDLVAHNINDLGCKAVSYHSKSEDRAEQMRKFKSGEVKHLTFVNTVSEGFDHKPTDSIVLMRPTRSPGLAIQQIGRTLRPHEDKVDALILDYAQVIKNIGPIDKPIIRQQGVKQSKKDKEKISAMFKTCPDCLEMILRTQRFCHNPKCNYDFFDDVIKNVNNRPDFKSSIFSSSTHNRVSWKGVDFIESSIKFSKSGNKMVEIRFKESMFDGPYAGVKDFMLFSSDWHTNNSVKKCKAYFNAEPKEYDNDLYVGVCKIINDKYDIVKEILVDETGQFPKILRVRRADGREEFVG